MSWLGIVIMIMAGLILFLLELLVLPGITVAGIGALVLFGGAIYLTFSEYGTTSGLIVLAGVLVSLILILFIAFRSRTWRRVSLSTEVDSKASDISGHGIKPGDEGFAITRLAPVGTVQIGDHRMEGRSEGPFIDHQTRVAVIRVEPTYVVVKPLNS